MAYPHYIETISDLEQAGGHLQAICTAPRCTRDTTLWPRDLIAKYGPNLPIETIRRQLKCAACGARRPTMNLIR